MKAIEYKGYTVQQSDYNHHVIISKDGKWVMHSQCDKPKTDDELRAMVDNFLLLMELIKEGE